MEQKNGCVGTSGYRFQPPLHAGPVAVRGQEVGWSDLSGPNTDPSPQPAFQGSLRQNRPPERQLLPPSCGSDQLSVTVCEISNKRT